MDRGKLRERDHAECPRCPICHRPFDSLCTDLDEFACDWSCFEEGYPSP